MNVLHKPKLFNKSADFLMPPKSELILSQQFINKKHDQLVTLSLTKDDFIIMQTIKKSIKICPLQLHIRFIVKQEKQLINQDFQSFILLFESDDSETVQLQSSSQETLNWLDKLRNKICLLDYQQFYDLDKLIGQGSFGSVYHAKRRQDGLSFAAKAFNKKVLYSNDQQARIQINNEISIMKQLNHQNLINLHEHFENKAQVYLILDLARGGSLDQAMNQIKGPIPYLAAKIIFRQILEGVNYMHEKKIMHRDLKPSNILFKYNIPLKKYGLDHMDSNVLISDFGIASEIKERLNVYQYCGSPGFMAPEVLDCQANPNKTYNESCDVFSLGCIFYQMLTGNMLFHGSNHELLKKDNQKCKIDFIQMQKDFNMSTSLTLLLQKMLSIYPDQRPTIQEILNSKILQVEYTMEGVPVFKNFNKPTSSPLKRHSVIKNDQLNKTVQSLNDIPEENKEERQGSVMKTFSQDLDKKQNFLIRKRQDTDIIQFKKRTSAIYTKDMDKPEIIRSIQKAQTELSKPKLNELIVSQSQKRIQIQNSIITKKK